MASEETEDRVDALGEWLTAEMKRLDPERQTELGQIVMSVATKYVEESPKTAATGVTGGPAQKDRAHARTVPRFARHKTGNVSTTTKTRIARSIKRQRGAKALGGSHSKRPARGEARAPVPEFFPAYRRIRESEADSVATARATLATQAMRDSLDAALQKVARWAGSKSGTSTPTRKGVPDDDPADILSHDQALEMLYERASEPTTAATSGDEMVNGQEMADYLGTSRQTINARYKKGTIIGLGREVGGPVYPKTQFAENRSPGGPVWLDGLDTVVAEHGNGWEAWTWLNNRKDEWGGDTPLERLQAGDVSAVKAALGREREGAFS